MKKTDIKVTKYETKPMMFNLVVSFGFGTEKTTTSYKSNQKQSIAW